MVVFRVGHHTAWRLEGAPEAVRPGVKRTIVAACVLGRTVDIEVAKGVDGGGIGEDGGAGGQAGQAAEAEAEVALAGDEHAGRGDGELAELGDGAEVGGGTGL